MATRYDIDDLRLTRRPTAVMRGEMPASEVPMWLANCYRTVHDYLRSVGMEPAGPPFARFTFLGEDMVVEAGFPCPREIDGDGRVEPSVLPAGHAVHTTHVGRYEDLEIAYRAMRSWLQAHGYAEAGPHWEVYFSDPQADPEPSHWRTDVVMPYRAA